MSESHPQPEPQPEEEQQPEGHRPVEAEAEQQAADGPAAEARAAEERAAEEQATVTEAAVRVQRSPRYFRFMITGAVVFAVIALILTYAFPDNPTYDRGAVFGFLLAICATIGVALGALVALLIDRAATRRARTVQADRIDVRLPGHENDPENDSPIDSEPSDTRSSDQRPSVDS
jgi:hypothetical protein